MISKEAAGYQHPALDRSRRCGTCAMFEPAHRTCTLVRGKILPNDTCRRWTARIEKK